MPHHHLTLPGTRFSPPFRLPRSLSRRTSAWHDVLSRPFASLDALRPATYREIHHKEAADTIPRLGPGQDAAMPPKDRHGKTAQDYRDALIAELDYCRRRKAQRSPLLFAWLLVPVALLWLNWSWVQRWLHPAFVVEAPVEVAEFQPPPSPPTPSAAAPRQAIAAPQTLDACLKQGNVVDEEVLRCRYGAVPRAREPASAPQGMVSAAYLAQYKAGRELAPVRTASQPSFTEGHVVPKWDGSGSYWLLWRCETTGLTTGPFVGITVRVRLSIKNVGRGEALV